MSIKELYKTGFYTKEELAQMHSLTFEQVEEMVKESPSKPDKIVEEKVNITVWIKKIIQKRLAETDFGDISRNEWIRQQIDKGLEALDNPPVPKTEEKAQPDIDYKEILEAHRQQKEKEFTESELWQSAVDLYNKYYPDNAYTNEFSLALSYDFESAIITLIKKLNFKYIQSLEQWIMFALLQQFIRDKEKVKDIQISEKSIKELADEVLKINKSANRCRICGRQAVVGDLCRIHL